MIKIMMKAVIMIMKMKSKIKHENKNEVKMKILMLTMIIMSEHDDDYGNNCADVNDNGNKHEICKE